MTVAIASHTTITHRFRRKKKKKKKKKKEFLLKIVQRIERSGEAADEPSAWGVGQPFGRSIAVRRPPPTTAMRLLNLLLLLLLPVVVILLLLLSKMQLFTHGQTFSRTVGQLDQRREQEMNVLHYDWRKSALLPSGRCNNNNTRLSAERLRFIYRVMLNCLWRKKKAKTALTRERDCLPVRCQGPQRKHLTGFITRTSGRERKRGGVKKNIPSCLVLLFTLCVYHGEITTERQGMRNDMINTVSTTLELLLLLLGVLGTAVRWPSFTLRHTYTHARTHAFWWDR